MTGYESTAQQRMETDAVPAAAPWSPQTPASAPPRPLPRWVRWAVPSGALLLGLAVGVSLGVTVLAADPTASEQYQTLQADFDESNRLLDEAHDEIAAAQGEAREAQAAADEAATELASRSTDLDEREAAVAEREEAVAAIEQRIVQTSIGTGIWTVGVDIEPGTYRTAEALTGYCYWAIYTSGTNGDDIIQNDGPEGGFPTVTLSVGQDFENSDCGTFIKQ